MDFLIFFIVVAVLGLIGTVLFWGLIGTALYKLFKAGSGSRSVGMGALGVDPVGLSAVGGPEAEFMRTMQGLSELIRQAQAAQAQSPTSGAPGAALPPELQLQFQTMLMSAQNEMGRFDDLSRQRHDTFVSGMLSDATACGLDVSGWSYS